MIASNHLASRETKDFLLMGMTENSNANLRRFLYGWCSTAGQLLDVLKDKGLKLIFKYILTHLFVLKKQPVITIKFFYLL